MQTTHRSDKAQFAGSPSPAVGSSHAEWQCQAELECDVETAFGRLEHSSDEWDEAVSRLGGNIYMTYDWLKTWWQFYGENKRLRLFLFSHGDQIVALLPVYLETFGIGLLRTTVARLVGANIPPKTFNPPVDPAFASEVISQMVRHLFRKDGCDLLSFGPVTQTWSGNLALRELGHSGDLKELIGRVSHAPRDVQTWFRLPATFEEYLAGLGSSERKNRLKRIRHLEKDHQVTADIVSDPAQVEPEFDRFILQHARQWQAVGKAGHFAAWPKGEAFNRALVKAQAKHGRVRFFRMLVDGQVVANRYAFLLGTTLYSELPAREVGEPWDKLGIGGISLIKFNEAAIQAEITSVDSGLGTYEHKAQLGGEQIPVSVWRVAGKNRSALKARAFCLLSHIVLFVCHKLWYRRILPRLPRRFKRTQSLGWLRFDA